MFGGGNKVKLSDIVFQKVEAASAKLGVSMDEFIEKVLEAEANKVIMKGSSKTLSKEDEEAIANSLKGLGYIE